MSEVRGQKAENGNKVSGVGCQVSVDRKQMTDYRYLTSEGGMRNAELGMWKLEWGMM